MSLKKNSPPTQYMYGFEYVRAFFSVMVVLWHTYPLGVLPLSQRIQDFVYFNIALLAVPAFFLVSLYLFYIKLDYNIGYFLSKRLPRLLVLYVFWMAVFFMFMHVTALFSGQEVGGMVVNYFISLVDLRTNRAYWFLFDLIILTIAAFVNWSLHRRYRKLQWQCVLLVLSIFPFFLMPYFARWLSGMPAVAVSNILNFLPYVFLSLIIFELLRSAHFLKNMRQWLIVIFILYGTLVFSEWLWLFDGSQGYWNIMPAYTRVSSVIASGLMLILATRIKRKPGVVIRTLSSYSFGIFLIHWYVALPLQGTPLYRDVRAGHAIIFVITLAVSMVLTALMKRLPVLRAFV